MNSAEQNQRNRKARWPYERHVGECEARVADQLQFIKALYKDGQPEGEIRARKALAFFEDALAAARRHLESERRLASA